MGHMGGLIKPRAGHGQYRTGFSKTGGFRKLRKRAPCKKSRCALSKKRMSGSILLSIYRLTNDVVLLTGHQALADVIQTAVDMFGLKLDEMESCALAHLVHCFCVINLLGGGIWGHRARGVLTILNF